MRTRFARVRLNDKNARKVIRFCLETANAEGWETDHQFWAESMADDFYHHYALLNDDGEVLAHARIEQPERDCLSQLNDVLVHQGCRRLGYGTELITRTLRTIANKGGLGIFIDPADNTCPEFYQSLKGWTKDDEGEYVDAWPHRHPILKLLSFEKDAA